MPDPLEVLLTEQEKALIARRHEEIQSAQRRLQETVVFLAELHGHYTGSLDYKDGKIFVTPPLSATPVKESNHR